MTSILPSRETMKAHGWTHQVCWREEGKPCFVRCKSATEAFVWAARLEKFDPVVIDLEKRLSAN